MLTIEEISERNRLLVGFIRSLDLGIHILELTHTPKLISPDYRYWFNGYVKNYFLILTDSDKQPFLEIRIKRLDLMDVVNLKPQIIDWMLKFKHKRIYTISLKSSGLFLVAFNYHNKLENKSAFPVFAMFNPIIYSDRQAAEQIKNRYLKYNLIVK